MNELPIGEHLLITLVPWLAGIIAGGVLGAITTAVAYFIFKAAPKLRKIAILLPWRGVLAALIVLALSPFIMRETGIGPTTGGLMVGGALILLTWAFSTVALVEHWYPIPLAARLTGLLRTLLMASGVLAFQVGFIGGGGVGFVAIQGFRMFRMELFWQSFAVVAVSALVFDIVLGVIQTILAFVLDRKPVEEEEPQPLS